MISNKRIIFLAMAQMLWIFFSTSVHASDIREHIRQAIQTGTSSGVISGPLAEQIKQQTGSTETPLLQVDAIKKFKDPDCKRLRFIVLQNGVRTKDGQIGAVRLPAFELNMCLDGQPPTE